MEVIAWTFNPSDERASELGVRFVELEELLARADVVSLHVKLTPDSHHLIGAGELAAMKEGRFCSTARAVTCSISTLCAPALNFGHLGGSGSRRISAGAAAG